MDLFSLLLKRIAPAIAIFFIILIAVSSLWQFIFADQFQLDISNESTELVDEVRVFGSAVLAEKTLVNIQPAQVASLLVDLKPEGELRVEISQRGNRIDHFIARDISQLEHLTHWLTIEPNFRFLINPVAPLE